MMEEDIPPERDVKDFKFQQMCRVRISGKPADIPKHNVPLVAVASKFGLTFIGCGNGFKVLQTAELSRIDQEHVKDRTTYIVEDFPLWKDVSVPGGVVSSVTLSCDDLTLSVMVTSGGFVHAYLYDVRSFADKNQSVTPYLKVRLTTNPGTHIEEVVFNPTQPSTMASVISDGTVSLYKVEDNLSILASNSSAAGICACWSPKGKQIVVGTNGGKLVQYDQELKEKREWPCPPKLQANGAHKVVGVIWLSTYSFLASYISHQAEDSDQPVVVITIGSKEGSVTYIDFDDPCYGSGEGRLPRYSFHYLQKWEMLVLSSLNSCGFAIIGKHFDNASSWEQWNLDDSARVELPLSDDKSDTFPMGSAIDFSSQFKVPKGDEFHPPCPILLVLSTEGLLIPYYMIYMHKDAPPLTSPPQILTSAGARQPKGPSGDAGKSFQGMTSGVTAPVPNFGQASTPKPFGAAPPTSSALPSSGAPVSVFGFKPGQPSLFGQATGTTQSSIIGTSGTPFTSKPAQPPVFRQTMGTTQNSILGTPGTVFTSKPAQPSGFGQAAGTTHSSLLGTPGTLFTSKPAQPPVFGQTTGTTQSSLLGTPGTLVTSKPAQPTGFGQPTGPVSTSQGPGVGTSGTTLFTSKPGQPAVFGHTTSSASVSSGPPFSFGGSNSTTFSFNKTGSGSITTTISGSSVGTTAPPSFTKTSVAATSAGFNFAGTVSNKPADGSSQPVGFNITTTSSPATTSAVFSVKQPAPSANTTPTMGPSTTGQKVGSGAGAGGGIGGANIRLGRTTMEATDRTTPSTSAFTGFVTTTAQSSVSSFNSASGFQGFVQRPVSTIAGSTGNVQTVSATKVQDPNPKTLTSHSGIVARPPPEYKPAVTMPTSTSGQKSAVTVSSPTKTDMDDTFTKSILEEMAHFEQEMAAFRARSGRGQTLVGTKQEMVNLKKTVESLDTFYTDIKTTTKDQNKEIEDQKSACLDVFSMVEECRCHDERNMDSKYMHLLKARALDPASLNHMRQLRQQYQVLDQGLRDVDSILDQQWQEHQEDKKNKFRIKVPTTDSIYKVLKSNRNLILGQKSTLNDLQERLKQLKVYNKTSSWQHADNSKSSRDNMEMSALTDSFLEASETPLHSSTGISNVCSPEKEAKLREHLASSSVPRIRSTKPENLSMSRILRTDKPRPVETSPNTDLVQQSRKSGSHQSFRTVPAAATAGGRLPQDRMSSNANSSIGQSLGRSMTAGQQIQYGQIGQQIQYGQIGQGFNQPIKSNAAGAIQQFSHPGLPIIDKYANTGVTLLPGQTNLGHIIVEDITPPSSTGYEEDEEDDDDDEDDYVEDDDDVENGEGFGKQYFMTEYEDKTSHGQNESTPKAALQDSFIESRPREGVSKQLFGTSTPVAPRQPTALPTSGSPAVQKFGTVSGSQTAPGFNFGVQASGNQAFPFGGGSSKSPGGESSKPVAPGFNFGVTSKAVTAGGNTTAFSFSGSQGAKKELNFSSVSSSSMNGSKSSLAATTLTTTVLSSGTPSTTVTFGGATTKPSEVSAMLKFGTSSSTASASVEPKEKVKTPNLVQALLEEEEDQDANTRNSSPTSKITSASNAGTSGFTFNKPSETSVATSSSNAGTAGFTFTKPSETSVATSSSNAGTAAFTFMKPSETSATASSSNAGTAAFTFMKPSETSVTASSSNTGTAGFTFTKTEQPTDKSASSASTGLFAKPTAGEGIKGLFGSQSTSSSPIVFGKSNATTGGTDKTSSSSSGGLFGQISGTSTTGNQVVFGGVGKSLAPTSTASVSSTSDSIPPSSTTATSQPGSTVKSSEAVPAGVTTGQPGSPSTSGSGSLFGKPDSTTTTFPAAPVSSSGGLFGKPDSTSTPATVGGLFTGSTSTGSLFGQPSSSVPNTAPSGGLFGSQPTATSSTGIAFGTSTAATTRTSIFGQPSASNSTSSPFGQTTAVSTTSSSVFGQPSTTSGIFGQPSPTSSSTGTFGISATTSSGGLFGTGGTPATTPQSSGSLFGKPVSVSSPPSFGAPAFGQSSGQFGQSASNQPSFGGDAGAFSGLGGKPSEEKANTNVFGGQASFSTPTCSGSLFGSKPTTGFGTTSQTTSGFSSGFGSFGGATSGVKSSGFGVSQAEQPVSGGFGAAPSFGSTPAFGGGTAFGAKPAFGGSPLGGGTFGGSATFSSPVGGSPAGGSGFAGFASSNSPTFGSLATATDVPTFGTLSQSGGNTGGFAGLAQQGAQQPTAFGTQPVFGGNPGFGSPGGTGGSGFGSSGSTGFGSGGNIGSSPSFTGYRS